METDPRSATCSASSGGDTAKAGPPSKRKSGALLTSLKAPTPTSDGPSGVLSTLLILIHGQLYVVKKLGDGRTGWSLRKLVGDDITRDVTVDEYGEIRCDCESGTMRPERTCKHIAAVCKEELLP